MYRGGFSEKLEEASRQARALRDQERGLDAAWNQRRNGAMLGAAVLCGIFTTVLVEPLGAPWIPGVAAPLAAALVWLGSRRLQERFKRRLGLGSVERKVVAACADLPPLPEELAEPIVRSLDSWRRMWRHAAQQGWTGSPVPAAREVEKASQVLLALFEDAARMASVGESLAAAAMDGPLRRAYQNRLARLVQAAQRFAAAEQQMAVALIALTDGERIPTAELAGLEASFAAIAEVLAVEPDELTLPAAPAEAGAATVRRGQGTGSQ